MLHSLRKRLEGYSEREAAGESLWTPLFPKRVRTRILHAFTSVYGNPTSSTAAQVFGFARSTILAQEGLFNLTDRTDAGDDFFTYFQACGDDMFPTVIEALVPALDVADELDIRRRYEERKNGWARLFTEATNEILTQERVGWEIIDGRMVEIHSKELHAAAVEPALRLLHRSEFANADKAYREALEELAQGKPWDAITDAGTALQETLTTLGCQGNQLGDLIRSAKTNGLLASHDDPMTQAIERVLHWVAADRSQMGDSHHATDANREDAWLIVHVVGAIIVRLASGERRN